MSPHADLIRGLTIQRITTVAPANVPLELCPEALIYSLSLAATCESAAPGPAAILRLQDSQIEVFAGQTIRADLPGLKFPASARLEIAAASEATLTIFYGNCG